ncbi:Hypothetical protein SMAX5B_015308 [Scophthalmus maximus]|uniref:Uncharacterized protein n=1 Tax=Scophthalmus maximus TaxID=52904 RepID=A0A2U9B6P4_SCOMX|nr:Hypothetical protein SMAX5B_015308 [Scophthalmus maximus]
MDNVDDYHIWQRRVHHGIRYQKDAVPFPESVDIGLEFNAALERKDKLDHSLLTNSVMLELGDFAKAVTKSEKYFLFEMLAFNFDLGVDVDDDMQYYQYATCVHQKIRSLKEQTRGKPERLKEAFPLPDLSAMTASSGSAAPGQYYFKRNKMVDSSFLTDPRCRSSQKQMTESDGAAQSRRFILKKKVGLQQADNVYPRCRELAVTLAIGPNEAPKQKQARNLLSVAVVLELLDFSRVLCGTHTQLVCDLVEQNFGLELDPAVFRLQFKKLTDRKYCGVTAEQRDVFRKKPFKFQVKKQEQKYARRRNRDADFQEPEGLTVASKRRTTLRHRDGDVLDTHLSYMCPIEFETEMDEEVGLEKMKLESHWSGTAVDSLDVKREAGEVVVSPAQPRTKGSFNSHPSDGAISRLFSEDGDNVKVKTLRQRLWMKRAARSKHILKSWRVNDLFARCRAIGLDFNVGSGNKQSLDLRLLTNLVLCEVLRFATAMRKRLQGFLFHILDGNFNLVQDEQRRQNFVYYFMTTGKVLQSHPARRRSEFLCSPFHFPEIYNVTSRFPSARQVKAERQTNCESSLPVTNRRAEAERHPFCKKLGLDLWSTEERPPSQKLDLSELTKGAVLDILGFVRELCGDVPETVNDILEHNFDLELQSGATEASRAIQRWYATQRSLMKNRSRVAAKITRWLNMVVPLGKEALEHLDSEDDKHPDAEGTVRRVDSYRICKEIGLDLDVPSDSGAKTKLDLRVLTRGVLFEVHRYLHVEHNCHRYVPALYEILEYNFDLSSQSHRKVEFAWSIAAQVISMVGRKGRQGKGDYMNKVFELPLETAKAPQCITVAMVAPGADTTLNQRLVIKRCWSTCQCEGDAHVPFSDWFSSVTTRRPPVKAKRR